MIQSTCEEGWQPVGNPLGNLLHLQCQQSALSGAVPCRAPLGNDRYCCVSFWCVCTHCERLEALSAYNKKPSNRYPLVALPATRHTAHADTACVRQPRSVGKQPSTAAGAPCWHTHTLQLLPTLAFFGIFFLAF
jgi:hypothetical protein